MKPKYIVVFILIVAAVLAFFGAKAQTSTATDRLTIREWLRLKNRTVTDLDTGTLSYLSAHLFTANLAKPFMLDWYVSNDSVYHVTGNGSEFKFMLAVSGGSITSVLQTTAPTDTTKLWLDNNAANNQVIVSKIWINGGWRSVGWFDQIAGHYSDKPPLYVLGTGQSNMYENTIGGGYPLGDLTTDSRVLRWNGSAFAMANIAPANNLTFQFAKLVAKTENRSVRYINVAGPGISIVEWFTGASYDLLIEAAIAGAGVDSIDVILFRQGEADNTWPEDGYRTNFYTLMNTWKTKPWFNTERPIVAGGLKIQGASPEQITYGVQQFYNRLNYDNNSGVLYAPNDNIWIPLNDIHIYGAGVDTSARRMFDVYKAGNRIHPPPAVMVNNYNGGTNQYNIYTYPSKFGETGSLNIAFGYEALSVSNVNKTQNVAIGYRALKNVINGYNVAIGSDALTASVDKTQNVGIGYNAGAANTGNNNTFINGARTGTQNGGGNTGIGYLTLNGNTGSNVTAIGNSAVIANGSGSNGTAIGTIAGQNIANQNNWVAIGTGAMSNNATGTGDVGIGYAALQGNTGGDYEVGIGFEAGKTNTFANIIAIGRQAEADAANQFVVRNNVTPLTTFKLQNMKFAITSPGAGQDGYVMSYNHGTGLIDLAPLTIPSYTAGNGIKALGVGSLQDGTIRLADTLSANLTMYGALRTMDFQLEDMDVVGFNASRGWLGYNFYGGGYGGASTYGGFYFHDTFADRGTTSFYNYGTDKYGRYEIRDNYLWSIYVNGTRSSGFYTLNAGTVTTNRTYLLGDSIYNKNGTSAAYSALATDMTKYNIIGIDKSTGSLVNITQAQIAALSTQVYPGAGIAVSTGSAWGTSITDNSANWNTAFGWGDHAGLYTPLALKTTLDGLNGLIKGNGAGSYSAVTDNSTNWNTAYTHANTFNVATPLDGQYLRWDAGTSKWINSYLGSIFDLTGIADGLTVTNYGSVVTVPGTLMWRAAADARYAALSHAHAWADITSGVPANLTSIGGLANANGFLKNNGSGTFSYTFPTASDVGLGNVTNESKATMFTNATFTGTFATAAGAISNASLANSAVASLSGTNTGDNAVNSLYSGLVSNATHTGDATGSGALTVVGINGTLLSGLATGILKNTTGTGMPSIAVAGTDYLTPTGSAAGLTSFPTLNQNTTGSAATLTTTRTLWGQNFNGSANVSGDITLGTANLTMTGAIASTASRVSKGWFVDGEFTNMPTVGGSSLATYFQGLDAQLTSLAALSYAGNANKFIRVNAGGTDFELVSVAGGDMLAANNLSDVANVVTARNNILPSKTGNSLKVLRVNAAQTDYELATVSAGGIADPGANGILARTALNTTVNRTITGTANRLTVTNGDGVSGNPTLDVTSTSAATASRIMERDANANTQVNTVIQNVTTTATAAGTTTLTVSSSPIQNFTGTSNQTIVLPDATTLANGTIYEIINAESPKVLTVNYNGGTLADVVLQNSKYKFTLTDNGTSIGTWFISSELSPSSYRKTPFVMAPSASTVAPTTMGNNVNTTATMSNTTVTNANPWMSAIHKRFQTTTTAGNATGVRSGAIQYFSSNVAGIGGFKLIYNVGQNINLNGGQYIAAIGNNIGALAGDPSALLNFIGIGYDAADASTGNFFLMSNDGSGVATKTDLGATNAARTTDIGFQLQITVPPNSSTFYVKITNLVTGVVVTNTSINTNVPAVNTLMGVSIQIRNGAVAAAANIEFSDVYVQPF